MIRNFTETSCFPSTTSAVDFSKETLVVKEEETYDAGVFGKGRSGSGGVTKAAPVICGAWSDQQEC